MTQIVLDEELRKKRQVLKQSLELCDNEGRIVARVLPTLDQSQYEAIEPHISEAELKRRRQEPDYSTKEVLDFLEKL